MIVILLLGKMDSQRSRKLSTQGESEDSVSLSYAIGSEFWIFVRYEDKLWYENKAICEVYYESLFYDPVLIDTLYLMLFYW